MTKKISQAIIKVTVITLLIGIFLIVGVIYNNFIKMQFAQHKAELELAVCGVSFGGEKYLQSLNGENYRITWIDKNGNIIFDSKKDAEDMDNHIEREEFKLAQKNGYGTSSRISSTLSQKTLYSAKKLNDGSVLRISTTQLSVISLIKDILNSIIIIAILAVILSIFFAKKVAQKTVEP
ncbi:MAG: PAS domain-containing sensor histidine kinase, partial [Oscillospiraceae bacterium]